MKKNQVTQIEFLTLSEDNDKKSHKMKIVCVNFRCMSNVEVRIKKGLTLLKGNIGTGKTTVLESILYTLYGTMRGQYTHGCKSCTATITIEPDIVIRRNSGPMSITLQVGEQKYSGAHAQEIINDLFGCEAIFTAGCYSQQGERCALLTGSNEEKMALLRVMSFRQDKVEIAHTRIAAALKAVQLEIVTAEKDFLVSQKELENHRKIHPRVDFSGVNVEELNVDELNVELKQIEREISKLEDRLKKVIQLEATILALSGISDQVSELPSEDEELKLKAEILKLQQTQEKLRSELNTIEVQEKLAKALESQMAEIAELKKTILEISQTHNITDDNMASEMERIVNVRKIASEFKRALQEFGVSSVGELRGQIGELGTQIDATKLTIQETQIDIDAKKWNATQNSALSCPGCKVQLRIENNTLLLNEEGMKFELKSVKNPNATEDLLASLRQDVAIFESKRSRIQGSIAGLVAMSLSVTEETEQDVAKLEAIKIRKTKMQKLESLQSASNIQIEPVSGSKETLTEQLQETVTSLRNLAKDLNHLENVKTQFQANANRLKDIKTSKANLGSDTSSALEVKIQEEKHKLVDVKDMISMAINIIKTVELEAQYTRHTETLNAANRKHEKLKQIQNLAKQTEISILERSVQVLNEQVNQFLSVMVPDEQRMTVKFSTTKETKAGKERMVCSITIFYKNVHYDNYKQLSRGEGDRLSLAIMMAINSLTDGKFILLDETLSTLDSSAKLRILDMLKAFAGTKKRCIIASHDIVEGSFDDILNF
jgi:DNA repair exonuclease SbcCD ATPase subunit